VANLVLLTYEATRGRLPTPAPVHTVGCPVNPKVLLGDRTTALARYGLDAGSPVVLLVGGSLGAAALNKLALAAAALPTRPWQLLWITGPRYHQQALQELGDTPRGVVVVGYEDRMADAYAAADLVVCRAGSSTLAELTALGKPSVLLPSPNVTDNHQEANARGLEAAGAAQVLLEAGLDPSAVLQGFTDLVTDPEALKVMETASRSQGRLDVAEGVAVLLEG
jgi:UDP-N-acetylglucosamine--N-acetylmuramyl-(pentapeptide) pyrophosphoryl-undecaprenol N-acetylglucosamine transferase